LEQRREKVRRQDGQRPETVFNSRWNQRVSKKKLVV